MSKHFSIGGNVSGTGFIVASEVTGNVNLNAGGGAPAEPEAGRAAAGAPAAKEAKRSSAEGAPTHEDLNLDLPEVEDGLFRNRDVASIELLLVVVTDVEHEAVLRHMAPLPDRNAVVRVKPEVDNYWLGKYGSRNAVLVRTRMGPVGAALSVQDAFRWWDPRAVVSVGIAFGLKPGPEKQCHGDVLVTERVAAYDLKRVTGPKMEETPRGPIQEVDDSLLQVFKSANGGWKFCDSNSKNRRAAKVIPGLWLSGSRLVDSATKVNEMLAIPSYKEAVGGDMEACGIMAACKRAGKKWIVVKGICDFAGLDGEKKKGAQPFAAAAAASLVKHVFEGHPFRGLGCVRLPDAAKANVADEGGAGKPKPDGEV